MPQDVGIADQQKAGKQGVGMVAKNSSVNNPTWYISLVFSHSHSTSTSLHFNGLYQIKSKRISSKYHAATSKHHQAA